MSLEKIFDRAQAPATKELLLSYNLMREAEVRWMQNAYDNNNVIYTMSYNEADEVIFLKNQFANQDNQRRHIIIIHEDHVLKSFDELVQTRDYFQSLCQRTEPRAAVQSTSMPVLLEHDDCFVDKLSYSVSKAYRSSSLSLEEVGTILDNKIEKAQNTAKNYQEQRHRKEYDIAVFKLKKYNAEVRDFRHHMNHINSAKIVGRVRSGSGVKYSAMWSDHSRSSFTNQHITILRAKEPNLVDLVQAPKREKGSKYGCPISSIFNIDIFIVS